MTKESIIALQHIDCNCNNCVFMERDMPTYKMWHDRRMEADMREFERKKAKAIADAEKSENEQARNTLLAKAHKMTFQFDKSKLINYGNCAKFNKPVSFLPGICQIETQECFTHR